MIAKEDLEGEYDDGHKPLDAAFKGTYSIGKKKYNVTIKGLWPENGQNQGIYQVNYADGNSKSIGYTLGTGWVEEGNGVTEHSVEIGKIIQKHFA